MDTDFEVIIIGGSYAGLSAAMALGRASRKTLVIDSGLPCNRHTPHSHNFLTRDGEKPEVLRSIAIEQVIQYPTVDLLNDKVADAIKTHEGFEVITDSGRRFTGKKMLFATGIYDVMPKVDGFEDCWGISAVHCPYCHGYEFKAQKTGILGNGEAVYHYAMLLKQWTDDLVIFSNGTFQVTPQQASAISQQNIPVIEDEICCVRHNKGYMTEIVLKDGPEHTINVLYHRPDFIQHSNLPETLGCLFDDGYIQTDFLQKTSIEGVYAAGDCATPMRSVANAVATGSKAGAAINMDLCAAEFELNR
jgi:thioredoxin reductase